MIRSLLFWFLVGAVGGPALWGAAGYGESALPDPNLPLRVRQTILPLFPRDLLSEGVMSGRTQIVIDVDEEGKLADWLVVAYTRPEFADAAVAAIRKWEFYPMVVNGSRVASQVMVGFEFEAKGVVLDIRPGTNPLLWSLPGLFNRVYRPCTPQELDRIPMLLTPVDPRSLGYTKEMEQRGITGSATVEFYIDESGVVRMPAVIEADFPELGHLAVLAVRQWTFEVPTSRGKPVLAHVRQRFDFRGADDKAEGK